MYTCKSLNISLFNLASKEAVRLPSVPLKTAYTSIFWATNAIVVDRSPKCDCHLLYFCSLLHSSHSFFYCFYCLARLPSRHCRNCLNLRVHVQVVNQNWIFLSNDFLLFESPPIDLSAILWVPSPIDCLALVLNCVREMLLQDLSRPTQSILVF